MNVLSVGLLMSILGSSTVAFFEIRRFRSLYIVRMSKAKKSIPQPTKAAIFQIRPCENQLDIFWPIGMVGFWNKEMNDHQ